MGGQEAGLSAGFWGELCVGYHESPEPRNISSRVGARKGGWTGREIHSDICAEGVL